MIAIVDDDDRVRPAVARLLRGAGYAVEEHRSGTLLLQSMECSVPDCIVLDLHMPDMSGDRVRTALETAGFRIPLLMLSADPEACARACPDVPCLAKPVDGDVLIEAIDSAIQNSASRG